MFVEKERRVRKRKQRKWWLGICCTIAMLVVTAMPVLADAEDAWLVDGSRLTNDTESICEGLFEYTVEPEKESLMIPFAARYLMGGTAQITNAGGGKVTVTANTKARVVCDKVELDIYLQYYKDGSWVHVNNWNYSVKNKGYLSAERTVSVTKGRYYRIRCYHAITKNGIKESSSTATNGIPIK